MADYDEDFEQVDAGSSSTYPTSAGSIKKNGFMVINGRPCKVVDYSTAKTGKHGHAKASITGIDIFNGKKYEDSLPTSHNVDVPVIKRSEWQAISVDGDGYVTLMDEKGNTRSDLKLPDETDNDSTVAQRISNALENGRECFITILSAMDIEKISDVVKDI
jgi:translation initiation factor 5A